LKQEGKTKGNKNLYLAINKSMRQSMVDVSAVGKFSVATRQFIMEADVTLQGVVEKN
jgi:hypothetical protein